MSYKHSSAVREFLRDRQRAYRAKKEAAAKQFKPSILRFALCGACHRWHPTQAIVPSGRILTVSLDFFHSQSEIDNIQRNFKRLVELNQESPQDAMNRCMAWRMESEGEDEEAARSSCEALFEDPQARERWEDKMTADDQFATQQEICVNGRMESLKETREVAESNCTLLLNDPLYRHFPPGLIPPLDIEDLSMGQIVTGGSESEIEQKKNIMTCFYHQIEVEKMEPEEAMLFCSRRAKGELSEEREGMYQQTVGDVYGKSRKEIDAMKEKPQDARLTVGNIFGKTRKQLLEEQRLARQGETKEPFTPSRNLTLNTARKNTRQGRSGFFSSDELREHVEFAAARQRRLDEEKRNQVKAQFKKKLGEGSE